MNYRKFPVSENNLASHSPVSVNQIDDPIRKTGLKKDFHQYMGSIYLRIRRFPDHHITHHGRGGGQVARNSREIKWRESKYESFQRPLFTAIPDAWRRFRLLAVNLRHKMNVKAKEDNHFACRINFRSEEHTYELQSLM